MATRTRVPVPTGGAPPIGIPYGRVSEREMAEEGLSLGTQQTMLTDYCARAGLRMAEWRYDVETGRHPARAAYQRTLAEARTYLAQGRRVAIVVQRIDRLGRQMAEFAAAYREITQAGGEVHSVREGGPVPTLLAHMLGSFAEEESRRIGERVADVVNKTRSAGFSFPGRIPWGYRRRPATQEERAAGAPLSMLDIDESTAPYVREAISRVAHGEAPHAVARWIASLPAAARGGRQWSPRAMHLLLTSRTYRGETATGEAGKWPAMMAPDVWRQVDARLAPTRATLPPQGRGKYLLTGMLHCPKCGNRMVGRPATKTHGPVYQCTGPMLGRQHNGRPCWYTVMAERIDAATLRKVEPVILGAHAALRQEIKTLGRRPRRLAPVDETTARRVLAERTIAEAQAAIATLTYDLGRRRITHAAYQLAAQHAEREIAAAERDVAAAGARQPAPELPAPGTLLASADGWRAVWEHATTAERRAIMAELVATVTPTGGGRNGPPVDAALTWSPAGDYLAALVHGETSGQ